MNEFADYDQGGQKSEFWSCGDHGAETESTVRLGWPPQGITVATREYIGPGGFKSAKLIPK